MNSENNTLVILTPGFPESEADTNCLPMQQSLVRCMKENNPQLNIIVLGFQYPYYKRTYKWFGITVTSFNGRNKGGLARLLLRRKIISRLNEISRNNKITGILSFWVGECAWVGKNFADRHHVKHYCWILGQDAKKENKYPGRIHAKENELIALSDFLQDEFEENHGTRPMHVIPPGTGTKGPGTVPKEKDIDILGAGSLIPLKQYDIFIELISEIKKEMPAVKAMLVGDGHEKENLQDLVTKKGLQFNITITGELPHADVLQLMQRTKVFLHPSSYEGFGVVLIEALQAGCHAISFNRAMKEEIDQWHIVKTKEEMKEKLLTILQNPGTVYKPVIPYSIQDTAKKMMKLFNA